MLRRLSAEAASLPLAAPFRISRGVKLAADVVVVQVWQDGVRGRGEAVPYARYGESVESVLAQVESVAHAVNDGLDRAALLQALPPGAARNAVDCALWDLHAQRTGLPVSTQLGEAALPPLETALTVGLDTPDNMGAAAARLGAARLVKIKLGRDAPEACLRAVRAEVPQARLIVDPNEGWDLPLLAAMQPAMVELGVDLVEQPLPADEDAVLEGLTPAIPICADESCHTAEDLPRLRKRYQAVNIKLDKTGGLTGALALLQAAREAGFTIMCGCMVASSLGIAPALHVARYAAFVDLDGPLWLKSDRPGGVVLHDGLLQPPAAGFWG